MKLTETLHSGLFMQLDVNVGELRASNLILCLILACMLSSVLQFKELNLLLIG